MHITYQYYIISTHASPFVFALSVQTNTTTGKGEDDDESSVWVSLVQLYNEQLYDMLRDPQRVHPLAIHEQANAGIYVQGLSEYAVHSAAECLQLLRVGREHR